MIFWITGLMESLILHDSSLGIDSRMALQGQLFLLGKLISSKCGPRNTLKQSMACNIVKTCTKPYFGTTNAELVCTPA
jgi:hypothetical protein